ncbi:hypothetical protein [Cryptosporangium arvum]|uniref:Uncharacterized protein n=1 Tax=Cryptosporangium arvum DSM 44712 TaxID=927661 RepID=A0A010ZXU0_9ACTN|nr:hypothetical protein [Cryptosporangium arvum]EXG82037.1 hypothetical protein CryarDRAFT_3169 [Cryptosporangium arvum DSM 44712]
MAHRHDQSGSRPEPASGSPFEIPDPYGQTEGSASASGVAAPLLAGGALALAGVVVQQEDALRYPGVVLLVLVGAILMLVASVQCGMWARQYAVAPTDIQQWWPDPNLTRKAAILRDQKFHAHRHRVWAVRVTLTFNLGVLLLWIALAVAVAPKSDVHEPAWRWGAATLAALGVLAEAAWIALVARGPVVPGQCLGWASRWLYGKPVTPPPAGPGSDVS